jgi:hypothetical protein
VSQKSKSQNTAANQTIELITGGAEGSSVEEQLHKTDQKFVKMAGN